MANKNRNSRHLEFKMRDADHKAFNLYSINNTKRGKGLIRWQMAMSVLVAAGVIALFWIFPVSPIFRYLVTGIAVVVCGYGVVNAKNFVIRSNEKALLGSETSASRIDPPLNTIDLNEEEMVCNTEGARENTIAYKDIHSLEINDDGIFVWVNEQSIMYIPEHAFASVAAMEETYDWLGRKVMGE